MPRLTARNDGVEDRLAMTYFSHYEECNDEVIQWIALLTARNDDRGKGLAMTIGEKGLQ